MSARILDAARNQFAEHGWAGTTIRAVARAADVDPALVYHYFGSKEDLLDAATEPPQKWLDAIAATYAATPKAELGTRLLRLMLESWSDEEIGPALRAIVLTAAHEPKTLEKLRMIVERGLIGVSTLATDEDERLRRSALIASQLLGLGLMRRVWKIEPVASMTDEEVLVAMAPNIQHYVDGDIIERPAESSRTKRSRTPRRSR